MLGPSNELIHCDDRSDAAKPSAFANRMIEIDQADLILGGAITGSLLTFDGSGCGGLQSYVTAARVPSPSTRQGCARWSR
jgi:hypothetical protein